MNRPASGSCDEVGGGQPGDAVAARRRTRRTGPGRRAARGRRSAAAGSTSSVGSSSTAPVPSGGCSQPTRSALPSGGAGALRRVGDPAEDDRQRRPVRAADRRAGSPSSSRRAPSCSRPETKTVPSGTQVALDGHRLADRVARERVVRPHHARSAAPGRLGSGRAPRPPGGPATRRAARRPSSTAAATSTSASRWPAHSARGEGGGHAGQRTAAPVTREHPDWSDHLTSDQRPCYGAPHAAAAGDPPLRARRGLRPGPRRGRRRRRSGPGSRCRASAGSPRCSASPGPRSARRCSGWPQTRLVEVRHGGATTVRDFRRLRRPRPAPPAARTPRQARRRPSRAASLEARLAIGPGGRGAGRGPRRAGAGGDADRDRRPRWPRTDDDVERQLHALEFWDHVVDAADSIVFRLMFNSLRAAYEPALEALAPADGRGGRPGRRLPACSPPRSAPATPRPPAPPPTGCSGRRPSSLLDRPRRRSEETDDQADPEIERLAARAAGRRRGADHRAGAGAGVTLGAGLAASSGGTRRPWLIATFLRRLDRRAASSVGGGSWWELLIPAALIALFPVIEWVIHVAILHWRPRTLGPVDHRLAAGPQPPRAPRRPARPAAGLHPLAGAGLAAAGVRRGRLLAMPTASARADRCWCRSTALMFGYEWTHYLVHSDYRPRSRVVPRGVAQPPAAPLQERALLVHRDQRRHRRPAVRHLPRRPVRGGDLADRQGSCTPSRSPGAELARCPRGFRPGGSVARVRRGSGPA